MAGAGDEAPDHGGLRVSDADREQAIDSLKTAFVYGRLDADEFDLRVGLALASRTHADLAALTADIPAEVAVTLLPSRRARARRDPSVNAGAAIIAAPVLAGVLAAAVGGLASVTGASAVAAGVFFLFILAVGTAATAVVAALVRGMLLFEARHARRSGGQLSETRRPQAPMRAKAPGPVGD